ncbi:MAG TPA: L-dopachrome tautomerase-related protein [Tepidisphaeraceae bacterium]|nr:L-dopachrome tautomerase-related protein [Tepidisphaeraceae bacterium]
MRRMSFPVVALCAVLAIAGCQGDHPRVDRKGSPAPPEVVNADLAVAKNGSAGLEPTRNLELVATFRGPMPTGVAVSRFGRVFVCFPRWGDPVEHTVGEVKGDRVVPYPDDNVTKLQPRYANNTFVSVQSVRVDAKDRLWILDTGNINFGTNYPGGPKLVCMDLGTNKVVRQYNFPDDVALATTYLNDVRLDLTRGAEGTAYVTDSSDKGPNGIIVLDLATGRSWRKLSGHPSVTPDRQFVPTVEGEPLKARVPGQPEAFLRIGSDGIALSADGKTLYVCPLASRRWYAVPTDALSHEDRGQGSVAADVRELPRRDFASDGLESDAQGRVYLTDYEHNAVRRWTPGDAKFETIAADPRMIWPDTLSLGPDGWLYVVANQLNRQALFQGKDERQQPYTLFRVKTDGRPVQR